MEGIDVVHVPLSCGLNRTIVYHRFRARLCNDDEGLAVCDSYLEYLSAVPCESYLFTRGPLSVEHHTIAASNPNCVEIDRR